MPLSRAWLAEIIASYPKGGGLVVGFSGGVDSRVLLHALVASQHIHHRKISAVYIHHGLQKEADQWQLFCQKCCDEQNIPFHSINVNIDITSSDSVEALARTARYSAFAKHMSANDILLTAQHENDQAETLLIQLFRSAGVDGLAAMPPLKRFSDGWHARPLLSLSRKDLEIYASKHALKWVEDPSNTDTRFTRNKIRHHVVPVLQEIQPSIVKSLNKVSENMRDTQRVLNYFLDDILHELLIHEILPVPELLNFPDAVVVAILRHWFKQRGYRTPPQKRLDNFIFSLKTASKDKVPTIEWDDVILRCWQSKLYLDTHTKKYIPSKIAWQSGTTTQKIFERTLVKVKSTSGIAGKYWQQVEIRFPQGGEKISLVGKAGRVKLGELLNRHQIPPWNRAYIPLLYCSGQLAAVSDIAIDKTFYVEDGEAYQLVYRG